jgi:DNA modification methylase
MSLIRADARRLPLVDGCAQMCVTSPPYWGLRDYGDGQQIGLEATPESYVAQLVTVFRDVWRVLKPDGTLWLNLGDSYNNFRVSINGQTVKEKDLIGMPWRVAFALQADGWYLRSDIIWSKPNPMPESVTDRPTKAHEYIFLLSKSARYYYDANAIAEPISEVRTGRSHGPGQNLGLKAFRSEAGAGFNVGAVERNRRSVWTVATTAYADAHFATFPPALVQPCILAGSRPGDLVLDPFIGSGTVGEVSERFGRRWVGTDLTYQGLSRRRTAQRGLRFEALA